MSNRKPTRPADSARDYSRCDLSAAVTIGRELLGHLVDGDAHVVALTPGREFIGTFPDRKAAILAILLERRGQQNEAARR